MYDETEYNLEVFEKWPGSKLDEIYNPIAVIIESKEKKKLKKKFKNLAYQKTDMHIEHSHWTKILRKIARAKTNFAAGFVRRILK